MLSLLKKSKKNKDSEKLKKDIKVILVDSIAFYSKTWLIKYENISETIVTDDYVTGEELYRTIMRFPKITEKTIRALDQKDRINYD